MKKTRKYEKPAIKLHHFEKYLMAAISQNTNGEVPVVDDENVELDARAFKNNIWK